MRPFCLSRRVQVLSQVYGNKTAVDDELVNILVRSLVAAPYQDPHHTPEVLTHHRELLPRHDPPRYTLSILLMVSRVLGAILVLDEVMRSLRCAPLWQLEPGQDPGAQEGT